VRNPFVKGGTAPYLVFGIMRVRWQDLLLSIPNYDTPTMAQVETIVNAIMSDRESVCMCALRIAEAVKHERHGPRLFSDKSTPD